MATDTRQLLAGRRVLVTGAAGAFGSATSAALRERGAAVAGLDVVVPDTASHEGRGRVRNGVRHCDVTDDAQVALRMAEVVDQLGGLDALVHFAGVGEPVAAGEPPGPTVRRTLDVNLLGPWRVTAAALPELTQVRGRVVFVASELAYATLPFAAAYAVSKRGVAAYADAVRLEYGTHVAVTTVYPGYVRTPIHDATVAAGLSMDGQVRAERVEDVVGTVLRVLTARRATPPRPDWAGSSCGPPGDCRPPSIAWSVFESPARYDAAGTRMPRSPADSPAGMRLLVPVRRRSALEGGRTDGSNA